VGTLFHHIQGEVKIVQDCRFRLVAHIAAIVRAAERGRSEQVQAVESVGELVKSANRICCGLVVRGAESDCRCSGTGEVAPGG
jgi:hypothetical protein